MKHQYQKPQQELLSCLFETEILSGSPAGEAGFLEENIITMEQW